MKIAQPVILKGLAVWIDLGVLKEEEMNVYKLLEVAEDVGTGARPVARTGDFRSILAICTSRLIRIIAVVEEAPAIVTAQEQQAEQMKVYWKARLTVSSTVCSV